jgi:hypothetical protein
MTANKAWSGAGSSGFSPASFVTWLKKAVKLEIPVGYQDESGFHTGLKADEKVSKWPATW